MTTDEAIAPVNGESVSPPPPPEPAPASAPAAYSEADYAPAYEAQPPEPPLEYPEQMSGRIINEMV